MVTIPMQLPPMPTTVPFPIVAFPILRAVLTALLVQAVVPGQEATPQAQKPAAEEPHFLIRRYPQDRDLPIAAVGDRPITLGELVDHLDEKHHPGFREALTTQPGVQRMLQSDLIAPWVRQYADLVALRHGTKDRTIDEVALREAQSAQLKAGFEGWLDKFYPDLRIPQTDEPSQKQAQKKINSLLADYQLRSGLAAELQGWLDYLEPDQYTRGQMFEFFNANARAFGGQVKFAHILVQHRDAGTGILLNEQGQARATSRIADIQARLLPDGSNFEEVARLCSEDTRTATEGGVVGFARRFDDRLPAVLCRAAWNLTDGQVGDLVESQYGWHLIKRLDFQQQIFILFTDDAIPSIRLVMRRSRQEEWLFKAREHGKVKLLL